MTRRELQRITCLTVMPLLVIGTRPAIGGRNSAVVISVGDGDTLRVRQGSRIRTVRLACIDAPETSQAPQGASARAALQALAPVGSALELRIQTTDQGLLEVRLRASPPPVSSPAP